MDTIIFENRYNSCSTSNLDVKTRNKGCDLHVARKEKEKAEDYLYDLQSLTLALNPSVYMNVGPNLSCRGERFTLANC